MMRASFLSRVRDDKRGATIVEFAIILMPMCTLMMGVLDIGYQIYATATLQGVVQAVGRQAALEGSTLSGVNAEVRENLSSITTADKVEITATSLRNFSSKGKSERLTKDVNGNNLADVGDCWLDEQENNIFDSRMTGNAGIGGAEDAVSYSVSMTYSRLTPIGAWLGFGNTVTITRSSLLRTEPYAGVPDIPTACRTS